jgi:hypothetical protein
MLTVDSAKQHAIDQGGKITQEYSLIKGFAYVATYHLWHDLMEG